MALKSHDMCYCDFFFYVNMTVPTFANSATAGVLALQCHLHG